MVERVKDLTEGMYRWVIVSVGLEALPVRFGRETFLSYDDDSGSGWVGRFKVLSHKEFRQGKDEQVIHWQGQQEELASSNQL